jgi:hypothetical protein
VEVDPVVQMCNDPKPLCKDHHCFGVFLKLFPGCGILSNSLLMYLFRCVQMCVCSKQQKYITMEHTSTICNKIDKPKHLNSSLFIK